VLLQHCRKGSFSQSSWYETGTVSLVITQSTKSGSHSRDTITISLTSECVREAGFEGSAQPAICKQSILADFVVQPEANKSLHRPVGHATPVVGRIYGSTTNRVENSDKTSFHIRSISCRPRLTAQRHDWYF